MSLAPATYVIAKKIAPKTSAVPRSGCKNTSIAGTARTPTALRKTVCSPTGFSAK
jgi:hypothetical protein